MALCSSAAFVAGSASVAVEVSSMTLANFVGQIYSGSVIDVGMPYRLQSGHSRCGVSAKRPE